MPILVGPTTPEAPPLGNLPTRIYLGDTGIVFNGDADAFGCRWSASGTNARGNKPSLREVTGDRDWRDGQWDGTRFYGSRSRTIEGVCRASDHVALHAAEQRLRDSIGPNPIRFRVTEPGFDTYSMMRQSGEILWTEINHHTASFSIALFAGDPFYRSTTSQSYSLGFPSTTGGLTLPTVLPFMVDAATVSGRVSLFNPGTQPSPLRFHVTGPVDDVTVALPDLGKRLTISNPSGATLGAADWLDVDCDRHLVVLDDTGFRRSWASGDWLVVPPGVTDLSVGSSGADPAAMVTVELDGLWL